MDSKKKQYGQLHPKIIIININKQKYKNGAIIIINIIGKQIIRDAP
jgi:hypothetical protein